MPFVNGTAATHSTLKPFSSTHSLPASSLSSTFTRSTPEGKQFELVPEHGALVIPNTRVNPAVPIPPPTYTRALLADAFAESSQKLAVNSQASLEAKWSSIQDQLHTRPLSDRDVLHILQSGILQTDTGKVLTPLLVDAVMNTVTRVGESDAQQVRHFFDTLFHLPPEKWASSFANDGDINTGHNLQKVSRFVQLQVNQSRAQEAHQINTGELLNDDSRNTLRDFTRVAREHILPTSEGPLDEALRKLEDLNEIRPSSKEAKLLMAELAQALREPRENEQETWSFPFLNLLQTTNKHFDSIEVVDDHQPSVPAKANFVIGDKAKKPSLLLDMQLIEKTSSFNYNINVQPLHFEGGISGKFLYALNALNGLGGQSFARAVTGHVIDAIDLLADPTQSGTPDGTHGDLSVSPGNGAEPPPTVAFQAASAVTIPTSIAQLEKSIREALASIDALLTKATTFPPLAAAFEGNQPLLHLETLEREMLELSTKSVYGQTVETVPSWWESVAPSIVDTIARLSAILPAYALGAGATATQLAQANPRTAVTAAFVALSALYNELHQRYSAPSSLQPHQSNSALIEEVESAALHQERIADALEAILQLRGPVQGPTLLDEIVQLMYESPENDLLKDAQLINRVSQLLRQPGPQAHDKTYAQLIHEAQQVTHEHEATARALDDSTGTHRVKRDTTAELVALDADQKIGPDEVLAALTDYIKKMEALQATKAEVDLAVEEETGDLATDAAMDVIRTIRQRRNVGWMDASRAAGDRELIPGYTRALLSFVSEPDNPPYIAAPRHSHFGQGWMSFFKAFRNPFFSDWAHGIGLDVKTVRINPLDRTLTGIANGTPYACSLTDNSGWAQVAGPIFSPLKDINPNNELIHYPIDSKAPLSLISAYYGESLPLSLAEANKRVSELNAAKSFSHINADDPRSQASSDRMKQQVGDVYNHSYLVGSLAEYIKDKADWTVVNLDDCFMPVSPDSSFAKEYPEEALRSISVGRFISDVPWKLPKTVDEVRNLITVVTFSLPEDLEHRNFRGALGNPRALTSEQLQVIRDTADELKPDSFASLYDYLLPGVLPASPSTALQQLVNSETSALLGRALGMKLDAVTTPSSDKEWVMAALLLHLDPVPGTPRNHVGGYNLTQEANWGAKPSTVVSRIADHLADTGKVSFRMAPVAAHHLLVANAPEFLVKNIPDNLVCGSDTWTTLRIAAARIEQISPGAVPEMTFEQVMAYGATDPINVGEEIVTQMVSVDPIIDWAISQGVIKQNPNEVYSPQQLQTAGENFQKNSEKLASAQEHLTAPIPSRIDIAKADLTRVFGDYPFEERVLLKTNRPGSETEIYYSMLDLHTTGQLNEFEYHSTRDSLPFAQFKSRLSLLQPVSPTFEKSFTDYFGNARTGSITAIKELISNLPSEDRKSLQYGKQRFFTLRSAAIVPWNLQTEATIKPLVAHHGVLIRSELGNKVTYYEIFPTAGIIRPRTDLPLNLELNGKIKNVRASNSAAHVVKAQIATPQPFDWTAYSQGTPPRDRVQSSVIIEELIPAAKRASFKPEGFDSNAVANMHLADSNVGFIAKTLVEEHFMPGRDELYNILRGATHSEQIADTDRKINEFLLGVIPFKTCIENAIKGDAFGAAVDCALDALGFIIPGVGAAGKIAKIGKSGASLITKALKINWITSRALASSANPLDSLSGFNNAVYKLGMGTFRAANYGIDQSKKLFRVTKAIDPIALSKRADIAKGTVKAASINGQADAATALFKNGNWYAFDTARNRPYGAPLVNFIPASSIPLQRTPLADGTSPLAPTKVFETEAHTIRRGSGDIDVVVGDTVYRFDPDNPEALTDLASPVYFKDLAGFDAVCGRGGIAKRTSNCFSKKINPLLKDPHKMRMQALEHKRLFPSTNKEGVAPWIVHERRLYNCDFTLVNCKPTELTVPLQFKASTKGKIIANEHFGFPGKFSDPRINTETRVVRVDEIIEQGGDSREVRAFIVNSPDPKSNIKYLVAEVDTGLFYHCEYDGRASTGIDFKKVEYDEPFGNALTRSHHRLKDTYLRAAGSIPNSDFILLPSLHTLYADLKLSGMKDSDIETIKKTVQRLSEEQQRELLVAHLERKGSLTTIIALPAIKIEVETKLALWGSLSKSEQNKWFANIATAQVKKQIDATGVKMANLLDANDFNEGARLSNARPLVMWEYDRGYPPNTAEVILKSGAGNCDQMALVADQIILKNGGASRVWGMPGHTFTLVGGPQGNVVPTVNFQEAAYANAWVVDVWAEITCEAKDYIDQLAQTMARWKAGNKKVLTHDRVAHTSRWRDATDPVWTDGLYKGPKFPR
ncbi:hypothetical protein ACQR3P_03360 [Rhodococcus sp. IEGM1300]